MKKQLSITALTCSALLVLMNPVHAEGYKVGDILYCESETGAYFYAPDYELIRRKTFKFRFKIESNQIIKFGSGVHFDNEEFDIDFWPDLDGDGDTDIPLEAVNGPGRFNIMNKGRFIYSTSGPIFATILTGTCDKF
jgi:hypothetical protein